MHNNVYQNCRPADRAVRKKNVVVIGAGPAGLAALRAFSKYPDEVDVVAYETSDRVGGTWIYNDKYKLTSVYDNLV